MAPEIGFATRQKSAEFLHMRTKNDAYYRIHIQYAGITFLALSNAAPDIFSQMSAASQESFGMTMGDSLGSSLFNVAGVIAIVVLIHPFRASKELLWKDALSFGLATLINLALVIVGLFPWWLCVVFPIIYTVYLVISWIFEQYQKAHPQKEILDSPRMKRHTIVQIVFSVLRFAVGVIWMNAFSGM
ncbi:Ca2+:Cation Antiporter [Blattamonas nauphoetae]|uniref:Ca2+:Cation Antiporter n=1 Tax=Blattamonas nauphoetae TaxID=2049346 RepID=A0ABQ9WST7_9EUKA|nr:Ca2+:Cation Antiporter [Blattamonas nauphoetae]